MRLDKLIHDQLDKIEDEYDLSNLSMEELLELEYLYKKAGSRWNGSEYEKPDLRKLTLEEKTRIDEISKKIKVKKSLKRNQTL